MKRLENYVNWNIFLNSERLNVLVVQIMADTLQQSGYANINKSNTFFLEQMYNLHKFAPIR